MPRGVGASAQAPIMVDATLQRSSKQRTDKNIATEQRFAPPCVPPHKKSTSEEVPSKPKTRGCNQRQKRRWLSLDLCDNLQPVDPDSGSIARTNGTERASSQQGNSEQITTQQSPLHSNTRDQSNSEQSWPEQSTPRKFLGEMITSRSSTDVNSGIESFSSATTTDTLALSPLLRMPVEISENILRSLLVADSGRICDHTVQPLILVNKGYRPPGLYPYSGVSPEILRVARRFYFEGLVILYSENVLYFQQTFSAGGTGLLRIETYLAKMSPVGRSVIGTAAFSVALFSVNLAHQDLGLSTGYDALGCVRDVKAAYRYFNINLPNVRHFWVFLWESYELAEEGDLTATLAQRRRDWVQRRLLFGIKQLILSLALFRGQTSVTVHGNFLWCVIAILFRNPSKFGPGLVPFYSKATPAGAFDCEVGVAWDVDALVGVKRTR